MRDKVDIVALVGGLCCMGALCIVAPPATPLLLGLTTGKLIETLSPNLFSDLFSRLAERLNRKNDPVAAAKNHDLRELAAQAIDHVLNAFLKQAKPTGKLAKRFADVRADIKGRLGRVAQDSRFAGLWEQNLVTGYFRQQVEEFEHVRSLTPEAWEVFLGFDETRDTDPLIARAFRAAAATLHRELPKQLVGDYRDAFHASPRLFVAVLTGILQSIWETAERTLQNTEQLKSQLDTLTRTVLTQHGDAVDGDLRVYLETLDWVSRDTLAKVDELLAIARRNEGKLDKANKKLDAILEQFPPAPAARASTNFPAVGVSDNVREFVGRERELAELHRRLAGGDVAVFHALSADGGFGKSFLAVRYACKFKGEYDGVWFVNASSPATAHATGRTILEALGEKPPEESDAVAARVAQVLSAGRHLLIVDDAQDLADVKARYALSDPARLLVTTRRHVYDGEGYEPFPLDVLDLADAVELLARSRKGLHDPAHRAGLEAVATHLHRHALAVALAAGYLKRHRDVAPADMPALLKAAPIGSEKDILGKIDPKSAAAGYRLGVAQSLSLNLPTLGDPKDAADEQLQRVLAAASVIDPRAIPSDLLTSAAAGDDTNDAILQLVEVCILRYGEGDHAVSLNVHGLTQELVRTRLRATDRGTELLIASSVEVFGKFFHAFTDEALDDSAQWPELDRLSPHAVALLNQSFGPASGPVWAFLCNQVGYFARTARGRHHEALRLFELALYIDRSVHGDRHPLVARDLINIGGVLQDRGDLAGALNLYVQAERIDRAALGDDHEFVGRDVNNIGRILQEQGDLSGALVNFEEAERIGRAALGDDHPNIAIRLNNIALVLQRRGDLADALTKFREAERILRLAGRDNRPLFASILNNIGRVLQAGGDWDGALAHFEQAERIDRAAYGDSHPNLAIDLNNIGEVLRHVGNLAGALLKFEEAERICRSAYGDQHPDVATYINNIAMISYARGDMQDALDRFREAERIDRAVYGDRHPNVSRDVGNIGGVLYALGDRAGARMKLAEAFDIQLRAYGARGEDVLIKARNLSVAGGDPVALARQIAGDEVAEELRAVMGE